MRQTALNRAIARLEEEKAVIQLAIDRLRKEEASQQLKKAQGPRIGRAIVQRLNQKGDIVA